jgi:hypothetical protein
MVKKLRALRWQMQWESSIQFLQIKAGRERYLSFLPELHIDNSFISNSDLKFDGLRLQNFGGLARGASEILVG